MKASIIGRIAGTTLVVSIASFGAAHDVAHSDIDHTAPMQLLSGTAGTGASTIVIDHLSGVEYVVQPRDVRGHAASYLSPRREAKGLPQRNAPKLI